MTVSKQIKGVKGPENIFLPSGNVGIGTTTPYSKLSFGAQGAEGIANTIRVYDDSSAITSDTSNSYGIGMRGSDSRLAYTAGTGGYQAWFTANTERMRILSGGNVGINTTAPTSALMVNGDIKTYTSNQGIYARFGAGDSYKTGIVWNSNLGGGVLMLGNNGDNFIVAGNGALNGTLKFVVNNTADPTAAAFNGNTAMTILSTGNVGIGTTSPGSKLEVEKNDTLGLELVSNGGFASDTTSWTTSGSTFVSTASGQVGNYALLTNSGAAAGYAYQTITTVVGARYILTYYFQKGTGVSGKVYVGISAGGNQLYDSGALTDATWGAHSIEFTATTTTSTISCVNTSTTAGETSGFDTISMKQVIGGSIIANGSVTALHFNSQAVQTLVAGSTAGTTTFSQPFQGNNYKKVIIYCAGLNGTASYNFPTAFQFTPVVVSTSGLATALVTSISTSACTVTGAVSTGILIIEGY